MQGKKQTRGSPRAITSRIKILIYYFGSICHMTPESQYTCVRHAYLVPWCTKGSCQVKKIRKSEKNSDWSDTTHPLHYPIFNFFWKHLETLKQYKKQEKTKKSKKKQNPSWGWTHPPTSEFFSDFWKFRGGSVSPSSVCADCFI